MVQWTTQRRYSPIGIDIGSRSVKLLQFDATRTRIHESARWDLPPARPELQKQRDHQIVEAVNQAREGHDFRGRQAIFCLGAEELFVQNIRVAQASGDELKKIVHCEAVGRLPYSSDEAEIRFFDAADVRQGDSVRREVILMACHRPVIERIVGLAESVGLMPVAIDVEPAALLRCYGKQFRRDDDQQRRMMFVNVGGSNTTVVIAGGSDMLFVKYIDVGGRHLDEAVARHLEMDLPDAVSLRRHNGDRRADQQDPEVTRSIEESVRPVLDQLAGELSACLRYHSVTFRGQTLSQIVLGGGEASQSLADWISNRLEMACELGSPLRSYENATSTGHTGQWDVAAGLALRETN